LEDPVEQAEKLLADVPLCDRCLGRLFAMLGRGLSNAERGRALKLAVLMRLHARIREGDKEALERFRAIAPNIGQPASRLYEELFGSRLEVRQCYLCDGVLDAFIEEAARKAFEVLKEYNVRRFLIGVRVAPKYINGEEELKAKYQLKYGESLKSELKREIGKLIQARYGLEPEFSRPEGVATIEFPEGLVEVSIRRLGVSATYRRWDRWSPIRPYEEHPLVQGLVKAFEGSSASIYGLVRDEIGVRVLGLGVPLVVEVSKPKTRGALSRGDRVQVIGSELEVNDLDVEPPGQESLSRRVRLYRCVIMSESPLSEAALSLASSSLTGKQVSQRVGPHEATASVRGVSCRLVADHVAECLVAADERLYVRELVTGEGTSPSLAEALGSRLDCLEFDLLGVISQR